jgi:hypothetical protein
MMILLIAGLTIGCSASKNYEMAYRRAWRKIVNSQAWQDALVSNYIEGPLQADVSHPLPSGYNTVELQAFTKGKIDESFLNTYRSLIFRAYFRTIAEAEKADARIYRAYSRFRRTAEIPNSGKPWN